MDRKKTGVIIINLGSPDSPSVGDVRNYLNEFLMDGRVMDMSYILRSLVVKGFIVPFRAPKSAEAYESIWTEHGSPLKIITDEFAALVQIKTDLPVAVAMRYGNATPADALRALEAKAGTIDEILIAPMYPHYAMSSVETAVEHVKAQLRPLRLHIKFRTLKPFYSEAGYISSLASSIQPYLEGKDFDGYLFSYHGLPIRHLKKSDATGKHCYSSDACCEIKSAAWETCYKHQVKVTTKLVCEKLNLDWKKVHISFQSRLGSGWIEPFTDKVLEELPKRGVKKLLTLCPAFVTDCLETLEEMDERGKESFMSNGGETYVRVPCLNTNAEWVNTFVAYLNGSATDYKSLWN